MKCVLITGASGFIGKRLVNCLKSRGLYIRAIGKTDIEAVETIKCNFLNDDIPQTVFNDIDTVIHLAGFTHDLQKKINNKYLYNKLNVEITKKLLDLSINSNIKRFIFISSVKAGGTTLRRKCQSEDDQSYPSEIYGKTKRDAELMVLDAGSNSNMHVSILRPSLVYGPNVKGNLSMMIKGIKNNWFPLPPDTKNIRSMIHVDDVVEAIQIIALKRSANMGIFIATDGRKYSTREIYQEMCLGLGKSPYKWNLPILFFRLVGFISPEIKYKIDKLLNDECYCSDKLKLLGFEAKKTLANINETSF
jgi:UDP-glucose 4-epimerase